MIYTQRRLTGQSYREAVHGYSRSGITIKFPIASGARIYLLSSILGTLVRCGQPLSGDYVIEKPALHDIRGHNRNCTWHNPFRPLNPAAIIAKFIFCCVNERNRHLFWRMAQIYYKASWRWH